MEFTVSATDADSDTLVYSVNGLPAGATFNASTNLFSWTPNYTQAAVYNNIQFSVTDSVATVSETISITVSDTNRAPVIAAIGNKNVLAGNLLEFQVTATDADNDTITLSASPLPSDSSFNPATGIFSWTPQLGQVGSYQVQFSASDAKTTSSQSITITVTTQNVNRPPVLAAIGNKNGAEGSLLEFTVSATDPDGDALVYTASNLPVGSTFNSTTRVFSWTPNYTQSGTYPNIQFSVSDGKDSASEAISITVSNTNRAPVLNPIGGKTVAIGKLLEFTVSASDLDSDALTYRVQNLPSGASFNASTRQFIFTPALSQIGSLGPIRFIVSDGQVEDFEDVLIKVLGKKAVLLDYNGDGKSDNSIYRPSSQTFYYYNLTTNTVQSLNSFGSSRARPVQGDFDGDGILDRAVVYDSGTNTSIKWKIKLSSNSTVVEKTWGLAGDVALAGDLNGDGRDEIITFRGAGYWSVLNENGTSNNYNFGHTGDIPKVQDFDGDGFDDLVLFRPSTAEWFISYSKLDASGNRLFKTKQWGLNGDIPAPGDFDGNGIPELVVYRPSKYNLVYL